MTPQELIDLPYAGMAEKQLRKMGKWRLNPIEIMENALSDALDDLEQIDHYVYTARDTLERAIKEATKCN